MISAIVMAREAGWCIFAWTCASAVVAVTQPVRDAAVKVRQQLLDTTLKKHSIIIAMKQPLERATQEFMCVHGHHGLQSIPHKRC